MYPEQPAEAQETVKGSPLPAAVAGPMEGPIFAFSALPPTAPKHRWQRNLHQVGGFHPSPTKKLCAGEPGQALEADATARDPTTHRLTTAGNASAAGSSEHNGTDALPPGGPEASAQQDQVPAVSTTSTSMSCEHSGIDALQPDGPEVPVLPDQVPGAGQGRRSRQDSSVTSRGSEPLLPLKRKP